VKRIVLLWLILIAVSAARIALLFDPIEVAAAEIPDHAVHSAVAVATPHLVTPESARVPHSHDPAEHALEPAPSARSVELALSELTRLLETPVLGRTRWELAARALAASLGESARAPLLDVTSDRRRSSFDLVAAAELLRRVAQEPELPSHALARLRQVAFGGLPDSASATAARRILAHLGDWSDRLELVRALDEPPTPETRIAAAWSLQAAESHDVLRDLAQVVEVDANPHTSELAVLVLESIVKNSEPLSSSMQRGLTETTLAAVHDADPSSALPTRAAGLLGALGGDEAREALLSMASDGPARSAAARVLAHDEVGRGQLLEIVTDVDLGAAGRLAAATALLRGPDAREAVIGTAVDGLRRVLETAESAEDRRRAVLALADCGTDTSRLVLEHTLLDDDDEGVRAAAVIAMARFEDRERFTAALEACARSDRSEGVRELATQVLE
jgi:HEAT repeat protein